jgi:peptide subunit release factor 1 (eRF1)
VGIYFVKPPKSTSTLDLLTHNSAKIETKNSRQILKKKIENPLQKLKKLHANLKNGSRKLYAKTGA